MLSHCSANQELTKINSMKVKRNFTYRCSSFFRFLPQVFPIDRGNTARGKEKKAEDCRVGLDGAIWTHTGITSDFGIYLMA